MGVEVNLSTSAGNTLTISGASANDFAVPANTVLALSGGNGLVIVLTHAGNVATVGGRINLLNGPHRLERRQCWSNYFQFSGSTSPRVIQSDVRLQRPSIWSGSDDSVRFQDGSNAFFNEGLRSIRRFRVIDRHLSLLQQSRVQYCNGVTHSADAFTAISP